jgi:hypothetical protein
MFYNVLFGWFAFRVTAIYEPGKRDLWFCGFVCLLMVDCLYLLFLSFLVRCPGTDLGQV